MKIGKEISTGKYVAIKIYPKKQMGDKNEVEVDLEVHIMKNLQHPNIVGYYGSY